MNSSSLDLSLYHPQGYLRLPSNPFGKDIANAGLFSAMIKYGDFDKVSVLNQIGLSADELNASIPSGSTVRFETAPTFDTRCPAQSGTLFRGQPYLEELAWFRRKLFTVLDAMIRWSCIRGYVFMDQMHAFD